MTEAVTPGRRVLLVEDDDDYAAAVADVLADMVVVRAETYDQALALVGNLDNYDCALVDLNLVSDKDERGKIIISVIKRQRPDFPVAALTAYDPGKGASYETILRDLRADDLVQKSGDADHGRQLRASAERLLAGELIPILSIRTAAVFERLSQAHTEWRDRLSRAEQWRTGLGRRFGTLRMRAVGHPLVVVAERASAEIGAMRDQLGSSLRTQTTTLELANAEQRLDDLLRTNEFTWASATHIENTGGLFDRLARWTVGLDMTILIVLAGVLLSFVADIGVRWQLDGEALTESANLMLVGGFAAGVSTMALANTIDRIHALVQEHWSGTPHMTLMEGLLAVPWQSASASCSAAYCPA